MVLAKKNISSEQLAREAAAALAEVKGAHIALLDVAGISSFADYFVIASGESHTHLRALARNLQEVMQRAGVALNHAEGLESKTWILMDYHSIIVHLFSKAAREYYGLEHLWGDAKIIPLEGEESQPSAINAKERGPCH